MFTHAIHPNHHRPGAEPDRRAGRGRHRPRRPGEHHPVHRSLPQGGHWRHRRCDAARSGRAPDLPAQPRGSQGRGTARHRGAGQAHGRPAREDRRGHGHAARRGPVQALPEEARHPRLEGARRRARAARAAHPRARPQRQGSAGRGRRPREPGGGIPHA